MPNEGKPYDPLVRQRLFPDPSQMFAFAPVSLEAAIKDGVVTVDTNVLLVPYTTGKASLEQIRRTYKSLSDKHRLRVPGQVAREFAENRAEKLKALYQQLCRKRNLGLVRSEYPLLENLTPYSKLVEHESDIEKALEKYRDCIGELLDVVAHWQWDDPVSKIYRELFSDGVVVDVEEDRGVILEDLAYRQVHKIPPGYKDANKDDEGIGDLLIWKTILKIGEAEKCHLIFVSGDEKSDWRYKSEGQALYPRFELVDEYRRKSGGKSFLMIGFADLLKQFGASPEVVAEVQQEESTPSFAQLLNETLEDEHTIGDFGAKASQVEKSVFAWLIGKFPEASVEISQTGYPDFIVENQGHRVAYEVKYLSRIAEIARRTREFITQAEKYVASTGMPVTIVLVVATRQDAIVAAKVLSKTRLLSATHMGEVAIRIGLLDDKNRFWLYASIDRAELPTYE
jgi:hypothetical protein